MAKSSDFYPRYILALFRRGRADELPVEYIRTQASQTLNDEEMRLFEQALDDAVSQGVLLATGTSYRLLLDQTQP